MSVPKYLLPQWAAALLAVLLAAGSAALTVFLMALMWASMAGRVQAADAPPYMLEYEDGSCCYRVQRYPLESAPAEDCFPPGKPGRWRV